MDHAQVVGQVALSGAHEEEPFDKQTQARWMVGVMMMTHAHTGEANQSKLTDHCAHLEEARMDALSPPKQERATAKGIVQFMTPNTRSANV